jgi:inward rectifier potassium channel
MGDLGSTRVFGQHVGGGAVVTVGLPRRPMRDLYHGLVTGSWARLFAVFALVYFATQALFGLGRLLLAAELPAGEPVVESLRSALPAAAPGDPLSARALLAAAFGALSRFVQWMELVLGTSIVIGKFSLVRARVLFSEVAVVGPHEGGQALVFRMANERTSPIVDAKVSVMLVRDEVQGDDVVRRAHDLALARGRSPLFSHTWTAIHPMDRASPLAGESAGSLEDASAEIIVNLSGFDEGLMRTVHARHVYPARRVLWNQRFREVVRVLSDGRHAIDYRKFHRTTAVEDAPTERTPARRRSS